MTEPLLRHAESTDRPTGHYIRAHAPDLLVLGCGVAIAVGGVSVLFLCDSCAYWRAA